MFFFSPTPPKKKKKMEKTLWIVSNLLVGLVFACVYYGLFKDGFTEPIDFYDCLYISLMTQSTVGFGDVTPVKGWARLAVCCQIVTTMILNIAMPSGSLTPIMSYFGYGNEAKKTL